MTSLSNFFGNWRKPLWQEKRQQNRLASHTRASVAIVRPPLEPEEIEIALVEESDDGLRFRVKDDRFRIGDRFTLKVGSESRYGEVVHVASDGFDFDVGARCWNERPIDAHQAVS